MNKIWFLVCEDKTLKVFNTYSEQSGRPQAGERPATLKFQTLILDAENAKIMILSYSQIENDILSTSNNVDLHIFCFSSLKL